MSKVSVPKGTRDFGPDVMVRRNYIFDTIKSVFRKYGFLQIETPSFERYETLMGKYGEEGDRLIFKILNSGDYLNKADEQALTDKNSTKLAPSISSKALRYDLTVPFARFVVQHQNELNFPFKRFQIQPVWRADRPGRGRYQEFYQCDADVVGSDSLLYEIECVQMYEEALNKLKVPGYSIKINNRKILAGIAEIAGAPEKIVDITVAIDKLDKIGKDGVVNELKQREISDEAINVLTPLIDLNGSNQEKLDSMRELLVSSEIGTKGVEELQFVFDTCASMDAGSTLDFDVTLARGLNYYTGAIFEVKVDGHSSICGGGRYDDLTGVFGLKGVSGVGISFGADRIYNVLEDNDLFPASSQETTQLLFINFGEAEGLYSMKMANQLRQQGINVEVYPSSSKMKKQMTYANSRAIPYVALCGSDEVANNTITIKNMESGEQKECNLEETKNLLLNTVSPAV